MWTNSFKLYPLYIITSSIVCLLTACFFPFVCLDVSLYNRIINIDVLIMMDRNGHTVIDFVYIIETRRQSARLAEKRTAQLALDGDCSSVGSPVFTRRPIHPSIVSSIIPPLPTFLPPPPPPPPLPTCLSSVNSSGPAVSPMKERNGLLTVCSLLVLLVCECNCWH